MWRVRASQSESEAATFDGTLIFHAMPDLREVTHGVMPRVPARGYFNRSVPFEEVLADEPFTLIVRARNAPVVVEFESSTCHGSANASVACAGSPAIIVHTRDGSVFGGLPDRPQADHAFDWHALPDER
jgi:hypothetical protein